MHIDGREPYLSNNRGLLSLKGRNEVEKTSDKSGNWTNREIMHLEMGNL
jgi:hypothetical protein